MTSSLSDLSLALMMADAADSATLTWWSPDGVASMTKSDGSPVTKADVAAECAVLEILIDTCPGDGFIGEELGERQGSNQRRWIVDGIDGTRHFTHGLRSWGTLIALEDHGVIVIGVASSPAQNRRWWAKRGEGAFTGSCSADSTGTPISVSTSQEILVERVVTLPAVEDLSTMNQETIVRLAGGRLSPRPWSHQLQVAEGEIDMCIWFCGDIWDHAALSIIVEEAGGRFTDHTGGKRLDTRTGLYSNGQAHDEVLCALSARESC
jgi:histidinol-phosphatase